MAEMSRYARPLMAVAVFMAMQAVAGVAAGVLMVLCGEGLRVSVLVLSAAMAGVATVAIISCLRMVDWSTLRLPLPPLRRVLAYVAASLLGIFALNILEEALELTDLLQESMPGMAASALGIVAVGLLGPVCEELVFREAVLGGMIRGGVRPWTAIAVSSLAFGIVHLNPAQVFFAFAVGMMLGYIYWKTGSIAVPCLIHVINNTASLAQVSALGEGFRDFSLLEQLWGLLPGLAIAGACGVACVVVMKMNS